MLDLNRILGPKMYGFAQRLPRSFAIIHRQIACYCKYTVISLLGEYQLFIASYYRQLSVDTKMKIIRLKPVLINPRGRRY